MAIHSEMERFSMDIATNEKLREEIKQVGTNHEAVVNFANARGYAFSLDDVNKLAETYSEISDTQLGQVVGGMKVLLIMTDDASAFALVTGMKLLVWW